jgi:Uma2 family endonuclease
MATAARTTRAPKPTANGVAYPSMHRFTVEQYHEMERLGIVKEHDRVELIHGLIVEKPRINPPHATALGKFYRRLTAMLEVDAAIRIQMPITLSDSEPEPDVVVAPGTHDDYETTHPGPKQSLLTVKVSDSSLADDQSIKLQLYAAARLPVYWIVNLIDRRVEVYTQPRGGKNPTYRARQDYGPDESAPVVLAGKKVGSIPVREILPR